MKTITLELTFKNDEDYFRFMDDWGCSEGAVRIPSTCKISTIPDNFDDYMCHAKDYFGEEGGDE